MLRVDSIILSLRFVMHTVVSATGVLVQYLLFREIFHRMSIIMDFSVGLLFVLVAILHKCSITL